MFHWRFDYQRALCDLGASVSLMPNTIFKKLNFGDLSPTRVSLQLADRSIRFPLGVLEDVPLQVGKLTIPCDFFVMEMPEDVHTPIILGRPCLATAGALIDVKRGKLSLNVGEDKVEFELHKALNAPSLGDTCYRVDVVEGWEEDLPMDSTNDDALQRCLSSNGAFDEETMAYERMLDDAPVGELHTPSVEVLQVEVITKECSKPPEVELKPLPSHLKYAFVGEHSTFPYDCQLCTQ